MKSPRCFAFVSSMRSMRLLSRWLFLAFCWISCAYADNAPVAPRTSLKLLTIGNSFADNITELLPLFAQAGGKHILMFTANLPAHSFEQHADYLKAFEADPQDPKGHPYKARINPITGEKKDFSLREALAITDWDVVSIQQASHLSFKSETFQPFAGIIIDYIHKYAPHAEIIINQTWAYPEDYFPIFRSGSLDQHSMYKRLKAAYEKLSADTGLRIIPIGDAFQKVRASFPSIPLNAPGDKHANINGKYLAAAVFYEAIYKENVEANSFKPAEISHEDARVLRRIAHKVLAEPAKVQEQKP